MIAYYGPHSIGHYYPCKKYKSEGKEQVCELVTSPAMRVPMKKGRLSLRLSSKKKVWGLDSGRGVFLSTLRSRVLGNLLLLVEGIEEGVAMEEEGEVNREGRKSTVPLGCITEREEWSAHISRKLWA